MVSAPPGTQRKDLYLPMASTNAIRILAASAAVAGGAVAGAVLLQPAI